jgi:carboxypeptidase family protein/TonB-dependent receptor-like protein
MRMILKTAVLLCLVLSVRNALAQTGNGSVGGIVQDSTKALIPGVSITLTNTATGVSSTQITNDTGAYAFQSVPPGNYKLNAELPGFKSAVANELRVGPNAQVRLDLVMEVGGLDTKVEVSVAADQLQIESTASVGLVLPEQKVRELPIVGQNVLDLIQVLPGFRQGPNGSQASGYTVGGLGLDVVNTTINGLSTNSARDSAGFWGYQTFTTNVINPDMIGEARLIIAPVDAELGRGNAQFQLQTRSGTNKYSGAAVFTARNSALDANTWANNKINTRPNWYNVQQYTVSVGGPIKKNKTFFFFLYDQQENHARELISNQVLTETARQGIFRYWTGWNPADALAPFPTSFTNSPTGTYRSVDLAGKPLAPLQNPDGSSAIANGHYTGSLVCFSVFGATKANGSPFTQADCPGGVDSNGVAYNGLAVLPSSGTSWDPLRVRMDQTGYIAKVLNAMPQANLFANFGGVTPDGLNTAIYRYLRHRTGSNSTNASIGVANAGAIDYPNRKQENLKIDHNFTSKHRVSFQWTYERSSNDGNLAPWDGKLNGRIRRRPELLTVNGTSSFTKFVNEARFGVNYSSEWAVAAWDNIDRPDITKAAQEWLLSGGKNPTNSKVYPVIYNPGTNANGFLNFTGFDFANTTPLWNYADTMRWSHGKHAFSIGGEYRRPMTTGFNSSGYATATTGNPAQAGAVAITQPSTFPELTGFQTTARTNTGTLLYFLNGSLATASTGYWIDSYSDVKNQTWRDTTTEKDIIPTAETIYGHQTRTQISNEWSFFIKDDFKMMRRLTLNLGIRYDYNMSPYLRGGGIDGLTNRFIGDGAGLFGAGRPKGGNLFDGWLQPGNLFLTGYGSSTTTPLSCQTGVQQNPNLPVSTCDPTLMSTSIFVGPGSPNPDKTLIPQSGRFGPAIGAAWNVPWFGDGKTTVRGGFQRTYGVAGSQFSGGLVSGPAADGTQGTLQLSDPTIAAIVATRALNLSDLATLIPGRPARNPGQPLPISGRFASQSTGYGLYAPDYVTPYTDNFTLSISRAVRPNITVDVRLVDTLGKKLPGTLGGGVMAPGSFDINTLNVYHNPELLSALNATRAGQDSALFDQMLMGLNLNPGVNGFGAVGSTVNGVVQRGSAQLRKSATFASNLANGNYTALVTSLITFAPTAANLIQTLPIDPATGAVPTTSQRLVRNGCDRIANGLIQGFTVGGQTINPRCFPENYFLANPQLSNGAAIYAGNFGHTNYQSFETQVRWRAGNNINVDATYSFSKTMQLPGSGYTDPLNRSLDYGKAPSSVGQELRANGVIELPIGPSQLLFAQTHGWVARLLEHWQTGFILNLPHGYSRSLGTAQNFLYNNGRPDVVGPWENPKGHLEWKGDNGYFFGADSPYIPFKDPQCTQSVSGVDALGTNLQTSCTLQALGKVVPQGTPGAVAVGNGQFVIPVLQNPQPGHQGTLGSYTMYTVSRWNLDANMSKTFKLTESKALVFRIDCTNVLNHPWPADPIGLGTVGVPLGTASNFSANNFGQIVTKGGTNNGFPRQFQAKLRFTF